MPIYDYECQSCKHVFTDTKRISERKEPESSPCPKCGEMKVQQVILSAPSVADPVRIGVTKKDSGFKEVLAGIHSRTAGSKLDSYL